MFKELLLHNKLLSKVRNKCGHQHRMDKIVRNSKIDVRDQHGEMSMRGKEPFMQL